MTNNNGGFTAEEALVFGYDCDKGANVIILLIL